MIRVKFAGFILAGALLASTFTAQAASKSFAVDFTRDGITVMCINSDDDCKVHSVILNKGAKEMRVPIILDRRTEDINFAMRTPGDTSIRVFDLNAKTGKMMRMVCVQDWNTIAFYAAANAIDAVCFKQFEEDPTWGDLDTPLLMEFGGKFNITGNIDEVKVNSSTFTRPASRR